MVQEFLNYLGKNTKNYPPKQLKKDHLIYLVEKYKLKNFVETGTNMGDTLYTMIPYCDQLYSIEVKKDKFEQVKEKVKDFNNVYLYCGDSATKIMEIINYVKNSTLFWLDAHNSLTKNPILKELNIILNSNCKDYVIVIDDLRLFSNHYHYPNRDEILKLAKQNNLDVEYSCDAFVIKNI